MRTAVVLMWWGALWRWLTMPAAAIQAEEQRQQARLIAGLAFALLVVSSIVLTLWVLTARDFVSAPAISLGAVSAIALAYRLSRTRSYQIGAAILVAMLPLMVEAIIFIAPGPLTDRMLAINFLGVAILLTSLFFSLRATLLVAVSMLCFVAAFFMVPGLPFAIVYSYLVFIAVLSALLIVGAHIRNSYLSARYAAEQALQESEARARQANTLLQAQMLEMRGLEQRLREQSIRDPLTTLYNRRYLTDTLVRELAHADREGYQVGILMIDLDHFKQVNDRYGHAVGDAVLQSAAALIRSHCRAGDIACRYGGEELLCVLVNIPAPELLHRAEELRLAIAESQPAESHPGLYITASIGVSCFPDDGATSELILRAADQAMYRAKAAGRNCVRVAGPA
jgi:diguanylate cyclase (GGDEF)-like protein